MAEVRHLHISFEEFPHGIVRMLEVVNDILNKHELGWEFGSLAGEYRIVVYREFETSHDADEAIAKLQSRIHPATAVEGAPPATR